VARTIPRRVPSEHRLGVQSSCRRDEGRNLGCCAQRPISDASGTRAYVTVPRFRSGRRQSRTGLRGIRPSSAPPAQLPGRYQLGVGQVTSVRGVLPTMLHRLGGVQDVSSGLPLTTVSVSAMTARGGVGWRRLGG